MSSLSLRLEGEPKGILLDSFLNALNSWIKMLTEIDTAISGQAKGSLEWVVTDLKVGSLLVEAESRSKLEDKNYGPDVVRTSIIGLKYLEEEGLTPPYLTETGINYARRLLKLIGNNGVTGIIVANHTESANLTARASANIDQVTRVRKQVIGSVEGRLEMISIHKGRKCVVYHHRTKRAVTCKFPEDLLDQVKQGLGKRVIAFGKISLNAKNEPVRVDLERLRILRPENELPSIARLGGSIPNFAGTLSSAEYVRSMRDE